MILVLFYSLSAQKTVSSAAGFVVVIHYLPIANCFIILNVDPGKIVLGISFLLSHTVHLFKYYLFGLLPICFFFYNSSRQVDQHSAVLVCQEGITVLSHFSSSFHKHNYAQPNSKQPRIQMGQCYFHCPTYFRVRVVFLMKMGTSDGLNLFIFTVTGEPCGLVSHKNY